MNHLLSQKISSISAMSMIMVVVLHAQNISNRIKGFEPSNFNFHFQSFISGGICAVAVPIFFSISGFLFYSSDKMETLDFSKKIRKRIKTLVVPYLLVSASGILLFFILQIIPFTKPFFNNSPVSDFNFLKLLKTLFITPLPYQLWFLRNLIVVILFSPVIYIILTQTKSIGLVILALIWIIFSTEIPYGIITTVFFFYLGGYLKIFNYGMYNRKKWNKYETLASFIFWIVSILLSKIFFLSYSEILTNISIIFGLYFIWIFFDINQLKSILSSEIILNISAFSFFIYLFHEPLLTIIIKLLFSILSANNTSSLIVYFAAPIFTVIICLITGKILKKTFPSLYSLISGGR